MDPSRLRLLLGLTLVAAVLAVYRPVRDFAFVNLDDPDYVQDNPLVNGGLTPSNVSSAFTTIHAGYWIPLTWMSYQLDYEFCGLAPGGYHRTNLLLHAANALLLFLLLCRLTGAVWASGFVAALFALHPIQVESVAWVTERKDVLSTFLGLLALYGYAGYVARPNIGRYLLVATCFVLSLLAKPMMVTLPCLLLLLDFWPLRRFESKSSPDVNFMRSVLCTRYWVLLEKLPLFAIAFAASVVTVFAQRQGDAVRSLGEFSMSARLGNAAVSTIRYLEKLAWPFDLAVFYPHQGESLAMWQATGSALVLAAITVLVLWLGRRRPYLAVCWLWFLGTLFPVSGVLQAGWQGMADRFLYVPSIGLFILVAFALRDLRPAGDWRSAIGKLQFSLAVLLLALLSLRTSNQLQHWRDSLSLWDHAAQVTPDNFYTRFSHGAALLDAGQVEAAAEHFARSVELKPDHPFGHYQLGLARRQQGRLDEAVACWTNALRLAPNYSEVHVALAEVLAKRGELGGARRHLRQAREH
jgi:tetratricopeptide (TPR) repeat protein